MVKPLDQQFNNWSELCDYVFSKIGNKLGKKDQGTFKKWFMARERVGWLIDIGMVLRCYFIWKELMKGLDHFIVISGREGCGKTTLSFGISAWVTPNGFDLENVCYGAKQYLDILGKKSEYVALHPEYNVKAESVVLDEGTELLSRESLNIMFATVFVYFF